MTFGPLPLDWQRLTRLGWCLSILMLLAGASLQVQATAIMVGPSTFTVTVKVNEDRGRAPPFAEAISRAGYAGLGQSSVGGAKSRSVVGPGTISGNAPTEADGTSTSTTLHALSRATGPTQFPTTPGGAQPSVRAHTRSESRRRYTFSSLANPAASTVSLDFWYALDGFMLAGMANDISGVVGQASMLFGLQIFDPLSHLPTTVFETRVATDRNGMVLGSATVSGVADETDWLNAISPMTVDPPTSPLIGVEVNYLGSFLEAFNAPVGRVLDFNWYLETESFMEGSAIIDALFESNFRDSATVGLSISVSSPGATFEEILSIPARVPRLTPRPR